MRRRVALNPEEATATSTPTANRGAWRRNRSLALKVEQAEAKLFAGGAWEDTGLVFVWIRQDGKPSNGRPLRPDHVTRRFGELVAASGLPRITFHGFRHSHGTALMAAGVNPKIAQERLGHHDPAYTLSVYAEVLPGMQEEAVAALEAATMNDSNK